MANRAELVSSVSPILAPTNSLTHEKVASTMPDMSLVLPARIPVVYDDVINATECPLIDGVKDLPDGYKQVPSGPKRRSVKQIRQYTNEKEEKLFYVPFLGLYISADKFATNRTRIGREVKGSGLIFRSSREELKTNYTVNLKESNLQRETRYLKSEYMFTDLKGESYSDIVKFIDRQWPNGVTRRVGVTLRIREDNWWSIYDQTNTLRVIYRDGVISF